MSHPSKVVLKEVIILNETMIFVDGLSYKKHDPFGKELNIIGELVHIIDKLTSAQPHKKPAALIANYAIATASGDIQIINSHKNNPTMAQTIQVLPGQNTVPGQLVPVASDNTTVEPISLLTPGSEVYTSSDPTIATVAADPSGVEGAFIVTRVPGKSGTVLITYTAVTVAGPTITNVGGVGDSIVFQGQPTGVAAALTATFGTPS